MFDKPQIDKDGNGILFNGQGVVERCTVVPGQDHVFLLQAVIELKRNTQIIPQPGQFYMLRTKTSDAYFKRPISVYNAEIISEDSNGARKLRLQFLILEKGIGTKELCALKAGDLFLISGPEGNAFVLPDGIDTEKAEICIVGGGIGIAPVANFAASLPEKSYDFYASFKTGSYGLERVKGNELVITTDDGSQGIKGMLPSALTAECIQKKGYKVIYACGPTPMLAYIQKIASECNVKAYLSVEHHMLCGAGACLGCTVVTKKGTLRVCKEGPVFDADILVFDKPSVRRIPLGDDEEPDISVDIAGVHFENPVFAAAGTFGYGQNFRGYSDVNAWGAICSKGTTLNPREGNAGQRCIEVPSGDINSIGLQNPGMQYAVDELIPDMMKLKPKTIINLAGSDLDSYVEATKLADRTDAPMIELNISCPNVKAGGQAWGIKSELAFECVSAVRKATTKPLMVKLSPNAPDLRGVAMACVKAGADALSLVNTFQAVSIDIENGKPWFDNIRAGLCGPAIKPLALRMVYDVVEEMNKLPEDQRIPIVGIGGISTWQDVVEFIMAGACAVQIGTATFVNPDVAQEVVTGLKTFMKRKGYRNIAQMCGIAQKKAGYQ
ncbi:MAG: dihydroorotate dehydrogenase [Treponema sp.]|nr:dihydroorotate dehydrogenase [Treponema sp.]